MRNKKIITKITVYLTVGLLLTLLTSLPAEAFAKAGNTKIDSLKKVIETATHDTTKAKALNTLASKLRYSHPDTAIILSEAALKIYKAQEDKKGTAAAYYNLGVLNLVKSDYPLALNYLKKSLEIRQRLADLKGIADCYIATGNIYSNQSDYPSALENYFNAQKSYQKLNDKERIALTYNNIGIIYDNQSDYPLALDYYFKSLKIKEELGNKQGMAGSYNNIGVIYQNQSDYPLALDYYLKSLKIQEELGNKQGMARSYNNIGTIYQNQSDYPLALDYYFKSLKIKEELGNKQGMAASYTNIGSLYTSLYDQGDSVAQRAGGWASRNPAKLLDTAMYYQQKALAISKELSDEYGMTFKLSGIADIYFKKGEYSHALTYYQEAVMLADSTGALKRAYEAHSGLAECYEKLGSHKLALEHYKQYSTLKDSVFNEEKSKDIGKLEAGYEYEIKMQEQRLEHEKKEAIAKEQAKKQRIIIWSVSGGFLLVVVFFILLFNRFRIIRRQKNIIQEQKALVDEKNKNITDSIRYAKEIQVAILPTDEKIAELLPESFVLFKPKDIVSGDFYWITQTKDNKVIWVAADCTGHGVPGAFMSMIGNTLLNEIIIEKGITEPAQILNELKTNIIKSLSQTGETGEHRDGMDIALCALDKKTNTLEFAGAYNPLYLVRKGIANSEIGKNGKLKIFDEDLGELKADRQPIGYEQGKDQPFTNHEIQLQKGDILYTFSDGYADQYGGDENSTYGKGKKFSKRRFKELVLSLQQKSMTEQKKRFDTTIENYKGDLEQIDDILVIGVRI